MCWTKRHCWFAIAVSGYLAIASGFAFSQGTEDLQRMSQDSNQWVMPLGDYSGTRQSKLNQSNGQNAAKLRVGWTMSTGALRRHGGQPPVVGKIVYVQSACPTSVDAGE